MSYACGTEQQQQQQQRQQDEELLWIFQMYVSDVRTPMPSL